MLCLQDHGLRSLSPWLEGEPVVLEMPGARAVFGDGFQEKLALGAALVLYSKACQRPMWS